MSPAQETPLLASLREIAVFSGLPDDQLAWLASQFEQLRLLPGEAFVRPGDPADFLYVILEGEVQARLEGAHSDGTVYIARAGQVTGYLPYSRMTQFPRTSRAVLPTRIARLHKRHFPEMLQRLPELGPRLVAVMSDRIREVAKEDLQRDKLMALGKLSAGLAHELNNPAAAARSAAASLREAFSSLRAVDRRLDSHGLSAAQRRVVAELEDALVRSLESRPAELNPLARSDRVDGMARWLSARGIAENWDLAAALADAGLRPEDLRELATSLSGPPLTDALERVAVTATFHQLAAEIEASTTRISSLVRAVKEYSFMDQAPEREVDIHAGLENTLIILNSRLKNGITVERRFDPTLPRVCAHGSELNQVWTNLIDNAIDAMDRQSQGTRKLTLCTVREPQRALVEIVDTGTGIPPEIRGRIFEPFFTTKPVGEGTGLGLDIVYRIIRRHHGEIEVQSRSGETRFMVRLPFTQPKASAAY